ncbi:MAG TPA: CHAT domain-containing protein [Vicinamibacteria bacterium]|nr:CHAT domain-containing protein [Vicinamibacteria bacterium]
MVRRLVPRTGFLLAACLLAGEGSARDDPFSGCAAQFAARPDDYPSSYCFFQVAQQEKRWDEAARRLDELRATHPRNFWLTLTRGNLEWTRDPARAEGLYREAAAGFAEQGVAEGEVLARTNLRTILYRKGRLEEAGREVERAVKVAESSGQDLVLARALALQATHLTDTGRDLLAAYRTLRRAERAAFPDGPYTLRRSIVFALGNTCFQLGRLDEALDHYRRVEAMTAEARDEMTRASAQYNVVNTLLRQGEELPGPGARDEVVALARSALVTAEAADNREIQAMLHRTLGELLGTRGEDGVESLEQYGRCVAIAREIRQPRELAHCLWSLARGLAEVGRAEEARPRIDEALALARETGHVWSLAHAARQRMHVSWSIRPRETAVAESLESLDAIEAVRLLQDEGSGAAEVFAAWTDDYHWLSGRLFEGAVGGRSREDLERAFAVAERMRARALLDVLGSARIGSDLPRDHPLVAKRRELLQGIVDAHRDLLDPGASAEARRVLVARLESLEMEEQEVRRSLRAESPRSRAFEAPQFAKLGEVEAQLGPTEALLSFQVGLAEDLMGEPAGGAWVSISTRAGTVVQAIPDRVRLQAVVPVFLGLFARRDGGEIVPSTMLFRDLLRPALSALPPGVDRLVLVPDDLLHRVPFAALREAKDREPLGARFEISIVPSATLWLRWRQASRVAGAQSALVLADPAVAAAAGPVRSATTREWVLASGEPLGALPFAREEGRAITRRLGGSTLWVGDAASEVALKRADLSHFSLLHFAAHAIADEERPERSAVLLAPGGSAEDGLLQSREIADLRLDGRGVVLSACRSAGGSVLRGEGVLSLARAFFEAGSPAVVGSLWPLRDDETARQFDSYYRHLARGLSLGAALRNAQRDAIAAGAPSAAWAGLVVLGDGSLVPFPGGAPGPGSSTPIGVLTLGGLLVVVVGWWTVVRRRAR